MQGRSPEKRGFRFIHTALRRHRLVACAQISMRKFVKGVFYEFVFAY